MKITDLPNDILNHIFEIASVSDIAILASVNKKFHAIVKTFYPTSCNGFTFSFCFRLSLCSL